MNQFSVPKMEDSQIVVEAQLFSPSNFPVGPITPLLDDSKQKKRRVNRACVYCNRSHMSCDEERPCKRCVTRGIAHMCKDPDTVKRRGRKATYLMPETQAYPQPPEVHIETTPVNPTPLLSSPNVPSPMMTSSPDNMLLAGSLPSNSDITISTLSSSSSDNSPQNYSPSSLINYFLTSLDNIEKYWSWASIENQQQGGGLSLCDNIKKEHSRSCSNNHSTYNSNAEEEFLKCFGATSKEQIEEDKKSIRDFMNILRIRIPEESEQIISNLTQRRLKTLQIIKERYNSNVELDFRLKSEAVKTDIESTIQTYRKLLEPLASPTIIYDRTGVIHYVNPAYRVLTGFSFALPTERSEFAFFKYILSPEALKTHFQVVMKSFEGYVQDKLMHAHIQPTAVRIHSELSERYMEGMLAINTKRDMFGMPFLFIATFLPFVAPDPGIFIESHKDIHI